MDWVFVELQKLLGINCLVNKQTELQIRNVSEEDREILLEWRNDPLVYKYSLNANLVSQDEHNTWFDKTLESSQVYFYMGLFNGKRCGTVRYVLMDSEKEAEVSISISPDLWGKGIAYNLMTMAEQRLAQDSIVETIFATVLSENKASMILFEKSNFQFDKNHFVKKLRISNE